MSVKSLGLRQDLAVLCDDDSLIDMELQADVLAPTIGVTTEGGFYPVLPIGTSLKLGDTRRNQDGTWNGSAHKYDKRSFSVEEFGWKERIDNSNRLSNLQYFDDEVVSARIARAIVLAAREKRVAAAMQNTVAFDNNNTDSLIAGTDWTTPSTAKPLGDINKMSAQCFKQFGMKKNKLELVITQEAIDFAMLTDEISTRAKYTINLDLYTYSAAAEYLRQYFGIKKITVVSSTYNAAGIGGAFSATDMWDPNIMVLKLPSFSMNSWKFPSLLRQPVFTPFATDLKYESYIDDEVDSTIVRVREWRGLVNDYNWGVIMNGIVV